MDAGESALVTTYDGALSEMRAMIESVGVVGGDTLIGDMIAADAWSGVQTAFSRMTQRATDLLAGLRAFTETFKADLAVAIAPALEGAHVTRDDATDDEPPGSAIEHLLAVLLAAEQSLHAASHAAEDVTRSMEGEIDRALSRFRAGAREEMTGDTMSAAKAVRAALAAMRSIARETIAIKRRPKRSKTWFSSPKRPAAPLMPAGQGAACFP